MITNPIVQHFPHDVSFNSRELWPQAAWRILHSIRKQCNALTKQTTTDRTWHRRELLCHWRFIDCLIVSIVVKWIFDWTVTSTSKTTIRPMLWLVSSVKRSMHVQRLSSLYYVTVACLTVQSDPLSTPRPHSRSVAVVNGILKLNWISTEPHCVVSIQYLLNSSLGRSSNRATREVEAFNAVQRFRRLPDTAVIAW